MLATPHSGWLWSDPMPQAHNLNNVAFIEERGYAVGEEGTVLRSDDGGLSWVDAPSGTDSELTLVQEVDPETVIVGGGCTVRESDNGGMSFARMAFDSSQEGCASPVAAFSFLTPSEGFLATSDGAILWTGNGGASFQTRTSLPLEGGEPASLSFLSPSTGVAVVDGKITTQVLRTENEGRGWTPVAEIGPLLRAVTFATPLVGYAVGANDTLLRTEDAGRTWKAMPLLLPPGTPPSELQGISCSSAESCLIATSLPGRLMRTTDGGLTGTVLPAFAEPTDRASSVQAVAFTSADRAVAVGGGGATAVSEDGGATFGIQLSRGVEFDEAFQQPRVRLGASRREAYIAAEHGQIAATGDSGQNWRLLRAPIRKDIVDVAFPRAGLGFIVAHNGTVYRTTDGGRSWKRCGPEGRAPGSLLAPSARIVIVTSAQGIWRSTNGCVTFHHLKQEIPLDHGRRLRPLPSFNLELGSAERVGRTLITFGRQILESTDKGAHWRLIPHPPIRSDLSGVSFLSPKVGYALLQGRIYFTRDAGESWREILSLPSNESAEPPAISFSSVADGYVATRYADEESGNIIFRTENGGRTWTPEALPNHIGGVTASGDLAYAVGESGGFIYVTKSGGLAGAPSHLELAISGPAIRSARTLAKASGHVTVHGRLTPAVAGVPVQISWLSQGGGWQAEPTTTNAEGAFALTVDEISTTTWFLAQWNGDDANRGAGTAPVRLTVRAQRLLHR
jgi:photosystem II stability/assembly factor-like uncharacterized protein